MTKGFIKTTIAAALLAMLVGSADALPRRDVVGYWTLNLQPGFNLVAFPVLPDTPTLQEVIGDRLGAVQVLSFDRRLGTYRYAQFNPETNGWTGDLFIFDHGFAYWIYLPGDEARDLVVTGHPELYTKFRWESLGSGWKFYAPTYGKFQELDDLPPDAATDYAIGWDGRQARFDLAAAMHNDHWLPGGFSGFQPDQSYIIHRSVRTLRRVDTPDGGEPIVISQDEGNPEDLIGDAEFYIHPPWPLVVGNLQGLPVCDPEGEVCSGGFTVRVMKEILVPGVDGEMEPVGQFVGEWTVRLAGDNPGKFRLALTVGRTGGTLHPGERVYLVVMGAGGASARSESFEIPNDRQTLLNVNFPEPMTAPGNPPATPSEFALGQIYPNPFNDRFQVEFSLPETGPVEYRMFDLAGRQVSSQARPMSAGTHRLTVTSDGLSAGIYLFEIRSGVNRAVAKVAYVK